MSYLQGGDGSQGDSSGDRLPEAQRLPADTDNSLLQHKSSMSFDHHTSLPVRPTQATTNKQRGRDIQGRRQERLMDDALRSLPSEREREVTRQGMSSIRSQQLPRYPPSVHKNKQGIESLDLSRTRSPGSVSSTRDQDVSVMSGHSHGAESSVDERKEKILGQIKSWIRGDAEADSSRADNQMELSPYPTRKSRIRSRRRAKSRHQSRRSVSRSRAASSDSDVLVTLGNDEEGNLGRSSPQNHVEQDIPPPPNESTANALTQAALRGKAKEPRLHFAPQERKIRRKDLPEDYEAGDAYRGLDDFVKASRKRRRLQRRASRRRERGSRAGSRSSRSSRASTMSSGASSSSASSDSDSNSSSSSSSSSASGRLTMARIRAFFGDDSSSSSSSSSSSDSSDSSNARSSHSTKSSRSFRLFRRRRQSSQDSDSILGSPQLPTTPRAGASMGFQLKGGAARRRKRRALRIQREQEKQLIREGKIPMRASKAARRKAKQAKQDAGGVTEYFLFTPVALSSPPEHATDRSKVLDSKPAVQGMSSRDKQGEGSNKILQTTSFEDVRDRLHALRRYKRQLDHADGDIGQGIHENRLGMERFDSKDTSNVQDSRLDPTKASHRPPSDTFSEGGDLALPPPAIDLPEERSSVTSSKRRKRTSASAHWHMSDVPLTPNVQFAMASEFSKGFEVSSPRHAFSPVLESHLEGQNTSPKMSPPRGGESETQAENMQQASGESVATKIASPASLEKENRDAAWWLDISCPTYRDMTELSRMFPLHPLTVEDVLQQDTREKVEMFDSLGYYFVVVRAIDERYFKYTSASGVRTQESLTKSLQTQESDGSIQMQELPRTAPPSTEEDVQEKGHLTGSEEAHNSAQKPRVDIIEGIGGKEGVEGVGVGAINMYLVVFSHGVISFHFEDVAKHINRVRDRVLHLTHPVELTSDWIAHGVLDSIIDSFHPLLSFVEAEAEDIERLTTEPLPSTRRELLDSKKKIVAVEGANPIGKAGTLPTVVYHEEDFVYVLKPFPRISIGRSRHILPGFLLSRRLRVSRLPDPDNPPQQARSFIQRIFGLNRKPARVTAFLSASALGQMTMLRRITDTRKIATGLMRLLSPKNDSIRGLRKRLVELRGRNTTQEEISIYMGDVHDHIVTFLTQLSSGEHRLGDIHLSYLTSIRINNHRVRNSTDEILVVLAIITVTVFMCVFFTSVFSLNVDLPKSPNDFRVFLGILAGVLCIPPLVIFRAWTLQRHAKRRVEARRAIR